VVVIEVLKVRARVCVKLKSVVSVSRLQTSVQQFFIITQKNIKKFDIECSIKFN
jgi:hypothetical protein